MATDMQILLDKLKSTGEAIPIDNVDITWNFNNLLLMSNEKLAILLAKTSLLPIISDFTNESVRSAINITSEQSDNVQNLNNQLIFIQGIIQKYCIQQYIIGSLLKKFMDEIVESLPEINMENLLEFIKNYDEFKNASILKGGDPFRDMARFIKTVIFLFFLLCLVSPTSLQEETIELSLVDPSNKQYSLGILHVTTEEFTRSLMDIDPDKSPEIKLNSIITKYDDKINRELQTVIGKLKSIISTPEFGNLRLENFLGEFNEELRVFSRQVEKICISLMNDAKDKKIFENYAHIDTIDETKEKLQHIDTEIEKSVEGNKKGLIGSVSGIILSAVRSDPIEAATYLSTTVDYLYDYISDNSKLTENKKTILQEQQSLVESVKPSVTKITKTQRIEFENKLFVFSQLYCSMGFSLRIGLNNDTIQIIGDRIPYIEMINLITTLEENIDLEMKKLSSEQTMTESVKNTVMSLDSLQQRLSVLKEITDYMYTVVNFSVQLQIIKMIEQPSYRTLIEFEEYLKEQLKQLTDLLTKLYKKFPLKEKELEETKKLIEEDIELQSKQSDIIDLIQNASSIARQRAAERSSKENQEWWLATTIIAQSYMDIGLNTTFFAKDNLKKYTGAFVDLAAEGPLELVKGLLRFLNHVLYSLFSNPSGWTIILTGLFIVEFTIGGVSGTIRIFKYLGKTIIAITTGTIIFVYELVKTPFGYIYRHISTLFVGRTENQIEVELQPQPDLRRQDSTGLAEAFGQMSLGRGGKYKKQRKTRKNKKRKTRKLKYGKRRQTKHKKNSKTMRH
jgi:hypothetical protein